MWKTVLQRDDSIVWKRFGRLIVLEYSHSSKSNKQTNRKCLCDCWNITITRRDWLVSWNVKSCWCLQKENAKKLQRKWFGESTKSEAWYTFNKWAEKRWYINELTYNEWYSLSQQKCYYCWEPPSNCNKSRFNNWDFVYNGIDRLINNIWYILWNVVPCCYKCNKMKMTLNEVEFIMQIEKIHQYIAVGTSASTDWVITN